MSLFLTVLLILAGCSGGGGGGGDTDSPSTPPVSKSINASNISGYSLEGSCGEETAGNIKYILSGQFQESITGETQCENGQWMVTMDEEDLNAFEDGEMTLKLDGSDFSTSIPITKDLVVPVLLSLYQTDDGKWAWECDLTAPCDEYRIVFNNDSEYEFSDAVPFSNQIPVGMPEDIRDNGTKDFYAHVQARDTAGNLSNTLTSDAFRFDNIFPEVQGLTQNEGTWSWGCNEENCEYRFIISNSSVVPLAITGGYGPYTSASPASGPDSYYIYVQARDSLGNESRIVSSSDAIIITRPDTTPPEVVAVTAVQGNYKGGDKIVLTVNFQEAVNITRTPRLNVLIGESMGFASFSGQVEVSQISHQFTYTVDANLNGSVMASGFSIQEGSSIKDSSGNSFDGIFPSNITVDGVAVDTTIPVIEGIESDANPATRKIWNWRCANDNCLYRSVVNNQANFIFTNETYGLKKSILEGSVDGTRYLHVQAKDRAGNESIPKTVSAIIDTTSSIVTINKQANFWSWECDEDTPCRYRVVVNTAPSHSFHPGDPYQDLDSTVPGSRAGDYYVHVQAKDAVGNRSSIYTSGPISTKEIDTTAAEISGVTSEIPGGYGIGDDLIILLSFNEPVKLSGDNIRLAIDVGTASKEATFAGELGELRQAHRFRYTIAAGDEGVVEIKSLLLNDLLNTIQDASGNDAITNLTALTLSDVTVDGIQPTVNLDHDNIDWMWSCSEGCSYRYIINQLESYSFSSDEEYNTNINNIPLSLKAGTNYLHLQAKDTFGNESEVVSSEYYFAGPVGIRSISQNGMKWTWDCSPIDDCETRFVVTASQDAPGDGAFSSYGDILEAPAPMGGGTYYLHLQAREKSDTSSISGIDSSAESISAKTHLWGSVSVGHGHTCALSERAVCWGKNNGGQLGINNATDQNYASTSVDNSQIGSGQFLQVYAGEAASCGLLKTTSGHRRVSCWGYGFYREIGYLDFNLVLRPSRHISDTHNNVVDMAMGENHSCALRANSRVICWGSRRNGELGDGNPASLFLSSHPITVKSDGSWGDLTEVVQVSVGQKHSCALKYNGTVWCWGEGINGEIGNGERVNSFNAQQVLRGENTPLTDIVQISAGSGFTCGVKSDGGTVWCWGKEGHGRRGRDVPDWQISYATHVPNLLGAVEVSLGFDHACVLKKPEGTVWCWGRNNYWQLGRGDKNRDSQMTPAQVVAQESDATLGFYLKGVSAISSGEHINCVSGSFKGILCWGRGGNRQLGHRSSGSNSFYPLQVIEDSSSRTALETSHFRKSYHCLKGSCFVDDFSLALASGESSPGTAASPTIVVDGLKAGESAVFYNTADCSGTALQTLNANGNVNLSAVEGRNHFHFKRGGSGGVYSGCSKNFLSYNLDTTGPVVSVVKIAEKTYSTGEELEIEVFFDEMITITGTPQISINGVGDAEYVSSNGRRAVFRYEVQKDINMATVNLSAAINLNGGSVKDSLNNSSAQVALANQNFANVGIDSIIPEVTIGTLAPLVTSGSNANVSAYPLSGNCETGVSIMLNISGINPLSVPCREGQWSENIDLSSILPGESTITVSQRDDLGNMGQVEQTLTVGPFEQSVFYYDKIAIAPEVSCAVNTDRQVYCWGINNFGVLGRGEALRSISSGDIRHPRPVIDVNQNEGSENYLSNVLHITVGRGHNFLTSYTYAPYFCALVLVEGEGRVRCWGSNHPIYSLLGDRSLGLQTYSTVPIIVKRANMGELRDVVQVDAGDNNACALKSSGTVWCWGEYYQGKLGIGSDGEYFGAARDAASPVMTNSDGDILQGVVQVAITSTTSCALTSSGSVYCWGREISGELGNGGGVDSISYYARKVVDHSGAAGSALSNVAKLIPGHESQICAVHHDKSFSCWGRFRHYYDVYTSDKPVRMRRFLSVDVDANLLDNVVDAAIGANRGDGCILEDDGEVRCWGRGGYGALGDGDVYASEESHIIIREKGRYGQSFFHSYLNLTKPVIIAPNVPVPGVVSLTASESIRCVHLESGGIRCWGRNIYGTLGDRTTDNRVTAVSVLSGTETDSAPFNVGKGPGRNGYSCRKGYSRCSIQGALLRPGPGQSNPNNSPNPVIEVIGLREEERVKLYSDSSCQTVIPEGELLGSASDQSINLTNSDTANEIKIYYQVSGDTSKENNACLFSALKLDRRASTNPVSAYEVSSLSATGSAP